MEKKLSNNIGLKVLSVFLAFFVWLAVVNINNPEDSDSKEVPLDIVNEGILTSNGKTYELLTDKDTVTVSYRVRTLDKAGISASDFRAYIDLADIYEPTGAVPVKIEVKNNRRLLDTPVAKPGVIRVKTEDLQRKSFEIRAKVIGEAAEGYDKGTPSVSPNYINVSGPMSVVGQISAVGIVINVDGADSNLSDSAPVVCFDANENEIPTDERITFSRSSVDYTMPILKRKSLVLNFEPEGRVADGYRYTGIESSRPSVTVNGLKSDLANINSITIPSSELNMDGATGDKEVTLDISQYLPEGVYLSDESSKKVKVVIKVEALESRTFELKTSQIKRVGYHSDYEYQYDRDSVNVVIRGLKEDLDQLSAAALGAEMDVEDMVPGENSGEITFQLGDAYELVSYDRIQVTVTEKGPSADSTAASTNESQEGTESETSEGPAGTSKAEPGQ